MNKHNITIKIETVIAMNIPNLVETISKHFCRYYGSRERGRYFIELAEYMNGEQFWRILHNEWSGFDAIDHFVMEQLLTSFASDWEADYLGAEDRAFYDSLPQIVTVYRGQNALSPIGLSWTTNFDIAKSFALGHRGYNCPNPIIIKASVAKQNIAGAYTDREESGILLFDTSDADIIEKIDIQPRKNNKVFSLSN
jgi:hypothetical protein